MDAGAKVGGTPESCDPDTWGITVLGPGAVIGENEIVPPHTMLNRDHKEVRR